MTPATIARLANDYKGPDLVGYLTGVLEEDKQVRKNLFWARKHLSDAEDVFRGAQITNRKEVEAIQARCAHYETTYHGDPAGGSDSFTCCDLCGKEM